MHQDVPASRRTQRSAGAGALPWVKGPGQQRDLVKRQRTPSVYEVQPGTEYCSVSAPWKG